MFFLDQAGRCGELDGPRDENGLGIPNAKRLKALQCLEQSVIDLMKLKFGVDFERRFEIGLCEALAGVGVEALAQLCDPIRWEREAAGVGMAAVFREQIGASLDSVK